MTIKVHINLAVGDLSRSISFYESLFGMPASKVRADYANFAYESPPVFLALVEGGCCTGAGNVMEFGFELPDDETFDAWRTRLVKSGLEYFEQESATCCYATGRKIWFKDPDGNRWEIFLHTGDADHRTDTDTEARAFLGQQDKQADGLSPSGR